jgi:hypothetical protein
VRQNLTRNQGESDYKLIPAATPRWKGNLNVGHFGTYCHKQGGSFGHGGAHWWRWTLRGDDRGKQYFTGSGARTDGWQAVSGALENVKVTPWPGNPGGASSTPATATPPAEESAPAPAVEEVAPASAERRDES